MAKREWQGTTYGNSMMHKWLIGLLKAVNIRILYVFSAIFVIPVCLVTRKGGIVIYHYFRKIWHYGRLKSIRETYRNHCLFAQVVIDRFAMYAGRKFKIEVEGYEHFRNLAAQKEGFIQLSAHIGNYEMAGYNLVAREKKLNALVFEGEKESVMKNREKMFAATNIRMIRMDNNNDHVFKINEALLEGNIISMPADRVFGSGKIVPERLLGQRVNLPMGPFALAAMRELNVLAVNVMKTKPDTYKIYVTPLCYDKTAPFKQQIRQLARAYVSELERILKLNPEQWYNYFEYWIE